MQIKIILTFVVAFLLVLFGIFNPGVIEINLFGFGTTTTPTAFFVFILFLAGAVYAGLISIFEQIKQSMKIRQLKRKLKDAEKNIQEERAKEPAEEKLEEIAEAEEEVPEETAKIPRIA